VYEEQEEGPCVTKILNFLSEHNIAIPSSRRKLTIKFMLEKLQELKQLGASIPVAAFTYLRTLTILKNNVEKNSSFKLDIEVV